MSMKLPTLSSAGFVDDPSVKLDRILSYFFIADHSQSNQHAGRVASLPYLIKNHAHDPDALIDRIQTALSGLLSSYFDTVSVSVSLEDIMLREPKYNIILEGSVSQDNTQYSLSRLLTISNNTLLRVAELQVK